jgi:CAAX prenyl protease-like protein
MTARIAPFATYLAFLAVTDGLLWLSTTIPSLAGWQPLAVLWLYPIKTAAVLGLLLYFWPQYTELKGKGFAEWGAIVLAVVTGLLVYAAWVRMNWPWATYGEPAGYNPFQRDDRTGPVLAAIRVFGASAVVPVMEELFWRSFLLQGGLHLTGPMV